MSDRPQHVALLIVPTSGYYSDVISGVQEFSSRAGNWLIEICADQRAAGELLKTWGPDAVLFDSDLFSDWLPDFDAKGLPRVQIGGEEVNDAVRISTDDVAVGRFAAEHYLENGYCHFAFTGYTYSRWSHERRRGYGEALAARGMTCHDLLDDRAWPRVDSVRDELPKWLESLPKPVAVFACHDRRAALVAKACELVGLKVPDQVAIVGVDDDPLYCMKAAPPLSSIVGSARRIGYEGALILSDMMRGKPGPIGTKLIPPAGVSVRVSSDALAVDQPNLAAAVAFIDQHAGTGINVDEVAMAAATSRRRLERLFRAHLHCSPRQRIVRAHIERAKHLLMTTDESVLLVALDSGFPSASKLSTVFRQYVGLTPVEFRRRYSSGRL